MSTHNRAAAIKRRHERLAAHIDAGKTVGEICDLEGLDPANEPKRMRQEGLSPKAGRNHKPAYGITLIDRQVLVNLRKKLVDLRDKHHYIEVARMVGITNGQQLDANELVHNWTLAQIQRLAVASNMTFEEMLQYIVTPPIADFRKNKS